MPGVPKSRGCDICRKRKKKCDLAKPTCSLCARLGLVCLGSGERRFKFMAVHGSVLADPLALVPASPAAQIAGILVSRLEVRDVRYDVSAYGGFLKLLPPRLGVSEALDSSIDAFSAAFSKFHGEQQQSLVVLKKYGVAIRAVRDGLTLARGEPSIELICAIYLIMLVQAWVGRPTTEQQITHEEGLACLVETLVHKGLGDEFEARVLAVIIIPVLFGSMTNPRIKLSPRFWAVMDKLSSPTISAPEPPQGKLPDHLRNPELYGKEIHAAYDRARADLPTIAARLAGLELGRGYTNTAKARARRDYQVVYSMALSMALACAQILLAMDPSDSLLEEETADYVIKIVAVAEDACKYIPIGSGFMAGSLSLACASTEDPSMKVHIQTLLAMYFGVFKGEDWIKMADLWYYKFMLIRCRFGNQKPGDDGDKAREETAFALLHF